MNKILTKGLYCLFSLVAIALSVSCQKNTNDKLSATELVNNPVTASNSEGKANEKAPIITFAEKGFNFGQVKEGELVHHTYTFTNTGTAPLLIKGATGSCGCTLPRWSHEPIAPNATGKIEVEFDSKNRSGHQHKTVTVTANTNPANTELTLDGEVLGTDKN